MRILAPAKINLLLRVGKRRDDGFHPLLTWMCSVGLFDKLTLSTTSEGLSLTCSNPALPTDASNLVLKAAMALQLAVSPRVVPPAAIHLEKVIPHGAGLGGGSSDAAFTLQALNSFWSLGLDSNRLEAIAATLGSDLNFFFHAPSALCTGRGEIVRPIQPPRPSHALLILPEIHMPTPAVFRQFDAMKLGFDEEVAGSVEPAVLTRYPARQLMELLVNDLETPAFVIRPELGHLRDRVQRSVGRIVRMSGSGSSLFTLYDSNQEVQEAADKVTKEIQVSAIPVALAPDLGTGTTRISSAK